tara:strand:- start:274 stop:666 length:393 start_codon:yes stop_codon:yes gene_type:complete
MKNLLIILGIFISTLSFSQVENGTLTSNYAKMTEWNGYKDKVTFDDFVTTYIYFNIDYYVISIDGEDPEKIYWEYLKTEDNMATYKTEGGAIAVFSFDSPQIIGFYSDYDASTGEFGKIVTFSKTSFESD